jgi:FkbM family methyltransferase
MMIRTFLERLSRQRVLQRRLPPRVGGGLVFVSPDSALRYWKWNLDSGSKDLFDFAEFFVHPGDVVWDVGANVGLFTFASAFAAGASGHVVAIEADTFLIDLLRKSAAATSGDRAQVTVLPVAVSNSLSIADFHIAQRGRSTNHLASSRGSSQTGGVRETASVMTVTLDWLTTQMHSPRVIKIDVEGAEASVLKGAEQLVASAKPVMLCEVSEENVDFCTDFLKTHGYTLYDFDNRGLGKIDKASFNTLAINER